MPFKNQAPDYEIDGVHQDNVLLKIWLHPTATLRYILAHCPDKYVTILLMLGGIARAVDRVQQKGPGSMSVDSALAVAVIVGGLTGWITYYFYSWGLEVAGRWLGGRAEAGTFRTIIAWALMPTCLTLLTTGLAYTIQGDSFFQPDSDYDVTTLGGILVLLLGLLEVVLTVWALVIFVKGTMFVQQFSAWRAIGNMVLPGIALLALVLGFMGLYSLLVSATS
jgi:hypothetical protein